MAERAESGFSSIMECGLSLRPKVNHLKKIRVGAVSYLNTRPLMYGFRQGFAQETIDLVEDYPARIAQKLLEDEVDVGLIPVAVTRFMKEWHIAADYCIGCTGPVASVCLFS